MSRGLGKVQRAIIEALTISGRPQELSTLTIFAFHPERYECSEYDENDKLIMFYDFSDGPDWKMGGYDRTAAQYKATLRAARTLEKRGLVTFEQKRDSLGPVYRWYQVSLSVDC